MPSLRISSPSRLVIPTCSLLYLTISVARPRRLTILEMVSGPLDTTRRGRESGLEPFMLVSAVIRYNVDDDLDPDLLESSHHLVKVGQRSDIGVNISIIRNIVYSPSAKQIKSLPTYIHHPSAAMGRTG